MIHDWNKLTQMTGGEPVIIERVRSEGSGIAVEGAFRLPPLAELTYEDQVFVAAFVKCHGSIKQMEKYFGISYPTVKNRLNKIGERLDFVEVDISDEPVEPESDVPKRAEVLDRLEKGEITPDVAVQLLRKGK
ncbi:DUF2089 family protein [candidate division GN15 bacterium]|nr:DUF2089 family protein [candidate division GN15 bacterium]